MEFRSFIPGKVERGGTDNGVCAHVFVPHFKLDGGLTMMSSNCMQRTHMERWLVRVFSDI